MDLDELKTMSAEELKNLISTAQTILNSKKEEVIFELSGSHKITFPKYDWTISFKTYEQEPSTFESADVGLLILGF